MGSDAKKELNTSRSTIEISSTERHAFKNNKKTTGRSLLCSLGREKKTSRATNTHWEIKELTNSHLLERAVVH